MTEEDRIALRAIGDRALIAEAHELRRAVENGEMCTECGATFVQPHGQHTACAYCWARLSLEEQRVILKAVHDEANVEAHKQLARQRKRRTKGNG